MTKSIFTIVVFALLTLNANAVTFQGNIKGEKNCLRRVDPYTPIFTFKFTGDPIWLSPNDSVTSTVNFTYKKTFNIIQYYGKIYLKAQNGFKVTSQDTFTDTLKPGDTLATHNFTVADTARPDITNIITPKFITINSTDTVKFRVTDNSLYIAYRDISVSSNGGLWETLINTVGPFDSSACGVNANKKYIFKPTKTGSCRIKIIYGDISENYDTAFTDTIIVNDLPDTIKPIVKMDSIPELFTIKSTHNIKWIATDNKGVVSRTILFSLDSGKTYSKIDSSNSNTGAFIWTIPTTLSTKCFIKIVAYDEAKNFGIAISNLFKISPPTNIINPTSAIKNQLKIKTICYDLRGRKIESSQTKILAYNIMLKKIDSRTKKVILK